MLLNWFSIKVTFANPIQHCTKVKVRVSYCICGLKRKSRPKGSPSFQYLYDMLNIHLTKGIIQMGNVGSDKVPNFIKFPEAFLINPDYDPYDKLVLLLLIKLSQKTGLSWASYKYMAEAIHISRNRVIKSIAKMSASGLILVKKKSMGTNEIRVNYSNELFQKKCLLKSVHTEQPAEQINDESSITYMEEDFDNEV